MQTRIKLGIAGLAATAAAAIAVIGSASGARGIVTPPPSLAGIQKIQHVVVIMQENRSFDQYFGTYPGVPAGDGMPLGTCVPEPTTKDPSFCQKPYHSAVDESGGGPHDNTAFVADVNGGKMDGFYNEVAKTPLCKVPYATGCRNPGAIDVMGYHGGRDIPNYWAYAHHFALDAEMHEPDSSWSLVDHLFMVSGWSAICTGSDQPLTCTSAIGTGPGQVEPQLPPDFHPKKGRPLPDYSWTDLTWLLAHHTPNPITWAFYVSPGTEPDCDTGAMKCIQPKNGLNPGTPGIWNPLPYFDTVRLDNQLGNIQDIGHFFTTMKSPTCTLPNVSWFTPAGRISEHPPALISAGVAYVTRVINAIMRSPCWGSTAIFVSWDDWGGFYDSQMPPAVDGNGYGLRVPNLVISPYAKPGYVDTQTLSHDAFLKFIEDDFLGGERICVKPGTDGTSPSSNQGCTGDDGRADNRPTARETVPALGDLASDFDFNQTPLAPLLLRPYPKTDLLAPPTATIAAPIGGQTFKQGQVVPTKFSCSDTQTLPGDGGTAPGIAKCVDSNGSHSGHGQLKTSKLGTFSYFVGALSKDGSASSAVIRYSVVVNVPPHHIPIPQPLGCSSKFPVFCLE